MLTSTQTVYGTDSLYVYIDCTVHIHISFLSFLSPSPCPIPPSFSPSHRSVFLSPPSLSLFFQCHKMFNPAWFSLLVTWSPLLCSALSQRFSLFFFPRSSSSLSFGLTVFFYIKCFSLLILSIHLDNYARRTQSFFLSTVSSLPLPLPRSAGDGCVSAVRWRERAAEREREGEGEGVVEWSTAVQIN